MRRKSAIIILFLLGMVFNSNAQSKIVRNADSEVEAKNYTSAINLYQKAIKNSAEGDKAPILEKIGDCFYEVNRYADALAYYDKYLELVNDADKEFLFTYAEVLLKSGSIDKALTKFEILAKMYPEDTEVQRMVLCCHFAAKEVKKGNLPLIQAQELINSTESEFGLGFFGDQLVFASQRFTDNYSSVHGRTNEGYSDMYISDFDSVYNTYSNAKLISGKINTPLNEGTFAYSNSISTAFFTQCEKNPELCRILKSKREKDKWKAGTLVTIGDEKYNYAHPCLTSDGKTMYFVSDMPGGFGGKDIWKASVLANGSVGTPIHLGEEINTTKDELFPSIIGDSILLFASEGHVGMGGLDIFYSKRTDDVWDRPHNVGAPINSTGDDFGILLNPDLNGGYFCSNGINPQQGDDIFAFYHNIFLTDIAGKVVDSLTANPLADVKIEYSTNNNLEKIIYTDSVGHFVVPASGHASCSKTHQLVLSKAGYPNKTVKVLCHSEKDLLITMFDNSGYHLITGTITDKLTKLPLKNVEVIAKSLKGYTDTTYTDEDGKYTFQNVPSNDYLIIRSDCPNYLKDSKTILTPDTDKSVVLSTNTNYETDFELYPIQKDVEFVIKNIYYEFDDAKLLPKSKLSLDNLINLLAENPHLEIKVNSHTDSRGRDAYNLQLSKRRSASVVNYLIQSGINSNRLISQGYGETQLAIVNAKTEEEHQKNRRTTFEIVGNTSIYGSSDNEDSQLTYVRLKDEVLFDQFKTEINKTEQLPTKSLPNQKITNKQKVAPVSSIKTEPSQVYRIQLLATSKKVDEKETFESILDEMEGVTIYNIAVGNIQKYQLGNFKDRATAEKAKNKCRQKGFIDCFVVSVNVL